MPSRYIPDLESKRLIGSNGQAGRSFQLIDGPWMEDKWPILDVAGAHRRSSRKVCQVNDCENQSYLVSGAAMLCHGHYWRWKRDGTPPADEWVAKPHRPVMAKNLPRSKRSFSFTELPPSISEEIRFVVGRKFSSGDWTPNPGLRLVLETLRKVVIEKGATSFTDRRPEDWILLVHHARDVSPTRFETQVRPYLRSFFSTLHRGLIADPWDEDRWLWNGMFDEILGADRYVESLNILWTPITQDWLREPLKRLARECLVSSTREWSTVHSWVRGFKRLSDFLRLRSVDDPSKLTRQLFLLFLEEQRATHNDSVHSRMLVNSVASVLTDLKIDGHQPDLASEIYLRPGENATARIREPRPWPKDVLGKIQSRILESNNVDFQVRLMLRFCRWAGPRISELVALPIDALLENGSGGYWIEYWMPKVKRHRRFPVPAALGRQLADEIVRVREHYGPQATLLFPQPSRSNAHSGTTRPWSGAGFREAVAALFAENGIHSSAITGELISGSDIHRFRHTIGTELLNNGWTQQEVMEFLGHASPTMTSAYARILDETLNRKVDEYHRKVAAELAENGQSYADPLVERMRARIVAVTPVGYCTLPADQTCNVRDNPCLTCPFHERGDGAFDKARGVYRTKLDFTIVNAKSAGDTAIAELNQKILTDLDNLEAGYR